MSPKLWFVLAALAVPASAFAQPSVTARSSDDYTTYDTMNAPVFATGAVMFAATYAASAVACATGDGTSDLLIPFAGPWLALDQRPACDVTTRACDHETTMKMLLVGDGILQAAGLLGILDGIVEPSSHVARHRMIQDTSVHVRPMLVGAQDVANPSPGFGVSGKF